MNYDGKGLTDQIVYALPRPIPKVKLSLSAVSKL